MNTGTFAGYLGQDAELRHTQSGKSVLGFSVGVSVGWGDNKHTLWVGCSLWGERGEKLEQYLLKGTPVCVTGDVDIRRYESHGEQRAEMSLNVQHVTLMGAKKEGGGSRQSSDRPQRTQERYSDSSKNPAPSGAKDDFDDDIPF